MSANNLRRRSVDQPIFFTVASGVIRRNAAPDGGKKNGRGKKAELSSDSLAIDVAALSKTLQVDYIPRYLDSMFYVGGSIYAHNSASNAKLRVFKRVNMVQIIS